ncbi:MAG: hypothetical protein RL215_2060 [Planctomycetota bacterium]
MVRTQLLARTHPRRTTRSRKITRKPGARCPLPCCRLQPPPRGEEKVAAPARSSRHCLPDSRSPDRDSLLAQQHLQSSVSSCRAGSNTRAEPGLVPVPVPPPNPLPRHRFSRHPRRRGNPSQASRTPLAEIRSHPPRTPAAPCLAAPSCHRL